ncbi:nuclear transport factor 2 family protein [Paucibacter soli]|uniref:nuclear transport factor 2 family protein n=1 Tax=Paucibacter soli TaxID=3133433 RepID=UPI003094B6AB
MPPDARTLATRFWETANATDWTSFAALLSPDMVYEVPQTRERVRGRDDMVEFFRTWPGEWRVELLQLIADDKSAVTVFDFVSPGAPSMRGMTFFAVAEGLITRLTDYWPEDYEPPARASAVVRRY